MNFIESFFGVKFQDLRHEDITKFFFEDRTETNSLEFKSFYPGSDIQKASGGIIECVAAMANSEGGMIIWGAPQSTSIIDGRGKKLDVFRGDLSPVDQKVGHDWFITRMASLITPTPIGVKFRELSLGTNEFVYLIEVDKSSYAPHQYDSTYYMRMDGHTRPAPHYFVEALFRKVTFPRLAGFLNFEINQPIHNEQEAILLVKIAIFNFSELQNEYDVRFKLIAMPGRFAEREVYPNSRVVQEGGLLAAKTGDPILFNSEPFVRTVAIHLPFRDVQIRKGQLRFELYFGGRLSPMKMSSYRLTADIIQGKLYVMNEIREENIFVFDRPDNGMSEIEKVEFLMGRRIID